MEQVPTTISRRKLALGGPAAVALAPFAPLAHLAKLAPLGAVAALGAGHNSAYADLDIDLGDPQNTVAAPGSLVTNMNEFRAAYNLLEKDIGDWLALAAARLHASAYPASTTHITLGNFIEGLTPSQVERIRAKANEDLVFWYKQDSSLKLKTFNSAVTYITEIGSGTKLNWMRQHFHRGWHRMVLFARFIFNASDFEAFRLKMVADEKESDNRHLWGWYPLGVKATEDRLEPAPGDYYGTKDNEDVVKLGNIRKTVERYELANTRHWFVTWVIGPVFSDSSMKLYGVNGTTDETGLPDGYISTSYKVTQTQLDAIEYYAEADIAKNNSFIGLDKKQSVRVLSDSIKAVNELTGYVYESYLASQIIVRCTQLFGLCATRWVIWKKKYINMSILSKYIQKEAMSSSEIQALDTAGKAKLAVAVAWLTGTLISSVIMSALIARDANDIVNENKGKNTTEAIDSAQATARFYTTSTTLLTTAGALSIGLLAFAGLSNSKLKGWVLPALPFAFAFADTTVSNLLFISIFRSGTQATAAGALGIVSAFAQILSPIYTIFASFFDMFQHYKKGVAGTMSAGAMAFATATSAVAFVFSVMMGLAKLADEG